MQEEARPIDGDGLIYDNLSGLHIKTQQGKNDKLLMLTSPIDKESLMLAKTQKAVKEKVLMVNATTDKESMMTPQSSASLKLLMRSKNNVHIYTENDKSQYSVKESLIIRQHPDHKLRVDEKSLISGNSANNLTNQNLEP